jgi:hypothetical protein
VILGAGDENRTRVLSLGKQTDRHSLCGGYNLIRKHFRTAMRSTSLALGEPWPRSDWIRINN